MKAVVAAFNQEKALVGAFSVITNLWMELFEALADSDNPLVLLASFTGQRFWVRTVHNYQEMGDTAPWVLRRLRGQEAASRGEMATSAWSRYSTRTAQPLPNIRRRRPSEDDADSYRELVKSAIRKLVC